MNKEQKIECLKKLEFLMSEWLELRRGGDPSGLMHKKILEMAKLWGVVSEILKGLDYKTEIEIIDDSRGKNIKPQKGDVFHNGVFASLNTRDQLANLLIIQSYVLSAIEKVDKGVIVRENVLPNVNLVIGILNTFPSVVSRLKHRRKSKVPFDIGDEYDVQDILYVMLKGAFSTLQYEDPTPKDGTTSARADFVINDLNTYIEAKYISEKGREKDIQDECMLDIQKYGVQENCYKIIFFVYDPNKCIDNQFSFKASLERSQSIEGKEIDVIALIVN